MSALPSLPRGRPTLGARHQYDEAVRAFCAQMLEIESRLDFRVSSRGWCYILENEGVVRKGEFDAAQRLINDCRKNGLLPLEICAVDDRRTADNLDQDIDDTSIEEAADI